MVTKTIKALCVCLATWAALAGCAATEARLSLPAQLVNPALRPDTPPIIIEYRCTKDTQIQFERTSDTLRLKSITDASTVNKRNAEATVAIIKAAESAAGTAAKGAFLP